MKGFFENFVALSVKKLKKVLMILPLITGRGRALLAESCRYMPGLAIRRCVYKRKHRRQGESAMRSELANINMQIIHSRAICR